MTFHAIKARITPVTIGMLVVGLLAIIEVVVVAMLLFRSFTTPPPLAYDQFEYSAFPSSVCPGGVMHYTPNLTVRDARHIEVSRTFWNRTTNRAARLTNGMLVGEVRTAFNYPTEIAGAARATTVDIIVPNLPAGDYYLIVATWGIGTDEARYQVPFTVKSDC